MGFGFLVESGLGRNVAKRAVAEIGENGIGLLVYGRLKQFDTIVDVRIGGEHILPAGVVVESKSPVPQPLWCVLRAPM